MLVDPPEVFIFRCYSPNVYCIETSGFLFQPGDAWGSVNGAETVTEVGAQHYRFGDEPLVHFYSRIPIGSPTEMSNTLTFCIAVSPGAEECLAYTAEVNYPQSQYYRFCGDAETVTAEFAVAYPTPEFIPDIFFVQAPGWLEIQVPWPGEVTSSKETARLSVTVPTMAYEHFVEGIGNEPFTLTFEGDGDPRTFEFSIYQFPPLEQFVSCSESGGGGKG